MASIKQHTAAALALVAAAAQAGLVVGHGWISDPVPRQLCASNIGPKNPYGPSTGNGSGFKAWNTGIPGFCGDEFETHLKNSTYGEQPCSEVGTVWEEGQEVDIESILVANHGGHYQFAICDEATLTEECFNKNVLTVVSHGSPDFYLLKDKTGLGMKQAFEKAGAANTREVTVVSRMRLPPGLTCERCVLMWTWWTGHTCMYPCDPAVCGAYSESRNIAVYEHSTWKQPMCETRYPVEHQDPQIFRNCADISIRAKGGGGGGGAPPASKSTGSAGGSGTTHASGGVSVTRAFPPLVAPPTQGSGWGSYFSQSATPVPSPPQQPPSGQVNKVKATASASTWSQWATGFRRRLAATYDGLPRQHLPRKTGTNLVEGLRRSLAARMERTCDVEEIDKRGQLSPVGNGFFDCGSKKARRVICEINKLRSKLGMEKVKCSNLAAGVAANMAHIMCMKDELLSDKVDNCNMSGLGSKCHQLVAKASKESPLGALDEASYAFLMNPEVAVVSVGFRDCSPSTAFWTVMLG